LATSLREQQEKVQAVGDRFGRNALRAAYHLRRHALVYIVAVLGLVALSLFPTVAQKGGNGPNVAAGRGATKQGTSAAGAGSTASATAGATAAGPAGATAAGGAAASGNPGDVAGVQTGSGVTLAGVACGPGVRQIPFSQYAAPCVSHFTGDNGGATANGVTGNEITIAIRRTSDAQGANSLAVQAQVEAAGGVSYDVEEQYTHKIIDYFNKTFEFYGRQIKLVDFNGQGNGTDESLGQGQAAACADADAVATSVHAFGVLAYQGNYESDPFAECAARYQVYIPNGAAYFPESEYQKLDPYVWAGATNCTLGGEEAAEFFGKQLAPFPARWAGTDGAFNMQNTTRKFATYVPNNAGYQECVANTSHILESQYGVPANRQDQYNYALDISQFPQDSQRAIIQFAANRDTSVVLACDPISPIFLTQDAANQNYHPEWVLSVWPSPIRTTSPSCGPSPRSMATCSG
jgi:hypothetical protein